MAIITNDKTLIKQFVKISFINTATSFPDFSLAEQRFLLPLIGDGMLARVQEIADAPVPADPTAEELLDLELLKYCRGVVVPAAYLLDLPLIQTQLTDGGLRTISTENMQAAHRWEYNGVQNYMADAVALWTETLLKFLFKYVEFYQLWTESDEYTEANELIFKTGDDFNKYFRVQQPFRIFWELRPLIEEVEDFYIESAIGEAFFIVLKEKEVPTAEEKAAIDLIKKSVAQYAIVKAVEKRSVTVTEKGFTLLISAGNNDADNAGSTAADDTRLMLLKESCGKSGDSYLLQLKEYLNKHASDTVFQEYFESDYYVAPPTEEAESKNANRKIFGL